MDWLNKKWKTYLEKNDKVILHTVIDERVIKIDSFLVSLLFGWIPAGLVLFVCLTQLDEIIVSVFISLLVLFVVWVLFSALVHASSRATHYVLTTKGVYKIFGLLYKRVKFVPYKRITDAEMTRGIIGHICDTANIGVCTASGKITSGVDGNIVSGNEIDITGIKDYKKVRQLILGKIK